ncbi:peptide-methionine (S)-S-oxide reductase MsrA [Shouchella lonarensis]|uniref:Peptide methionine sulfoxide reductase MsrA n=1 Tax=Shouchella lonarensis TaxID=1464122 RepID=A0A1G6IW93_9BACI|nr:peptide-methionine (S)-S-oxide reductase MsrA [Shouchella lonarensis]SDC10703.1 peptide-methionine (S)-S-oxide reductase/peptide methionine sulfoxide reductase msrA/msrB [Shouchella lonarensis]
MAVKKATFAGGCFWCMVKPFTSYDGIIDIKAGYTGGHTKNPTYKEVCSDTTGHVEAVQITYDAEKFPYTQLLDIFWQQIDPTDAGGQFYDRGLSYRTAIFYHDEHQREAAIASKRALEESGKFQKPIVTPIEKATTFYPAEEEHQDYYKTNPEHYTAYYRGSGRKAFIDQHWGGKNDEA